MKDEFYSLQPNQGMNIEYWDYIASTEEMILLLSFINVQNYI